MGSDAGGGWPFWAATSDQRIRDALRLAGLRRGERLIDLGCGDGRVLLRAAEDYGAEVTGVELDPALAAIARDVLAAAGIEGSILEADFESVPIDADVVFAFLSPATLQRLRPRLAALPPTSRVVTTGYPVPAWLPDDLAERVFLYRLPPQEQPVDRALRGWVSAGALVSITPEAPALMAVKFHPPGGPVSVTVDGDGIGGWLTIRSGADEADAGEAVVVDLRFDPAPDGTAASGALHADGVGAFRLFVVADCGEPGIWGLSGPGCDLVAERMQTGEVASVLERARRETE